MKAVYGDEAPLYSTVTYWKRNFQIGHMSLTDEPRSGRPSLTITGAYYSTLLNKLRYALKIKHRGIGGMLTKGVCLLAYNAPAHSSQAALWKQGNYGFEILPHPPYSSDFAPSNFFFPQMKSPLKGRRFDDTDEVIQEVKQWFSMHSEDFYNDGMRSVKHR